MQLTTTAAISIALGETFDGPQLVLSGVNGLNCHAEWSVARSPQDAPILHMTDGNGLLTLATSYAGGVWTTTITPVVTAAAVAALTPGEYQHDVWFQYASGGWVQLLGPKNFQITSPITKHA